MLGCTRRGSAYSFYFIRPAAKTQAISGEKGHEGKILLLLCLLPVFTSRAVPPTEDENAPCARRQAINPSVPYSGTESPSVFAKRPIW